ncbi:CDP-glycerol glycerophosphotransferase family protein [Enterococcus dongliensis]|uniref:CDP-glycerol glycerophosphotransferase family protein n=1 Tax=Enterococcus dongliensis TaxID=2559925 RepID=UPI0028918851|nr:CDP-glycerol glycerophosphotransferase family protein [Enterococcus dongliensis]MDT2603109.1 CDP-glycerol glycerophosphotransferase family protein [Enterococcus dongliensis]MDT2675550.1 CDP-glycerol glycerophosphotransferase family protein [Enterococcus dongliensis]
MSKIQKFFSRNICPIIFKLFPLKKKRIVFSSFGGRNYSGNPRIISEEIQKSKLSYELVWLLKNEVSDILPDGIKRISTDSLLASYYLYTSKFWIDDSRKTISHKKRNSQVYFQTWHGTPLKKIEFDAKDKLSKHYLKYAENDSESITYLLSGNKYSSEIYPSAFRIEANKILNIGTPRNDQLVKEFKSLQKTIYDKETINILFAPTFRNDPNDNGVFQLEKVDLTLIKEYFQSKNQKINFLVKFHPNVNNQLSKEKTSLEYMAEHSIELVPDGILLENLFSSIDLLITDYSSIFFDYALLGKPLILFNYDEKKYAEERGFYIELNDLPVPKAQNAEDLIKIISFQREELLNSSRELLDYLGNYENGNSTQIIIESIVKEDN